ncbi:MAG: multidrug efflux RND transporter permease subunit [Gammaproteobacteria bacterium]|nr:MAG: multidrug efflux RND transporter permease subunit [Gammaproteobacteria bacterium]
MANFFIDRPIFAWVIAIFIILSGLVTAFFMPIAQYPPVAAPTIQIQVNYPGASAETLQQTVLSIIEREVNAADGLDYIESIANANGTGSITLTFTSDTDENKAQIDVQNLLKNAEPRLPGIVRSMGIGVTKSRSNFLLFNCIYSTSEALNKLQVADYVMRNIRPALQRIDGVGNVQVFSAEPGMRIWLDPAKMRSYGLSTSQVAAAVKSQNIQISAGTIGAAPLVPGQLITATIGTSGQLQTVAEFENIIVKSNTAGATVRLKDIARVQLGSESFAVFARLNGKPMVGIGIQLATTGNAVAVASDTYTVMEELARYFPAGMEWKIPYDSSTFVRLSIEEVVSTLAEAILLVVLVMLLFLQNMRYTIIPTLVVPISLLGAVSVMSVFGLSFNVLTMFAMVLVIGIVVDDAIVVVENVERLMDEEGLSPKEAAHKGMTQITGAVVGITVVLVSVFVPLAFFPGATGNIYRQFSLVMMGAIFFSAFLALSLTPALCATLLKPIKEGQQKNWFFARFNTFFNWVTEKYRIVLRIAVSKSYLMMLVFLLITGVAAWLYGKIPTSFLPQEDQGYVIVNVQLPPGASQQRTIKVMKQVEDIVLQQPETENIVSIIGFSFSGQGPNMGLVFVPLKPWDQRIGPDQSASAFARRLMGLFFPIRDAFLFAINPPPIAELGNAAGFDLRLEDRSSSGHDRLLNARNILLGLASQNSVLAGVRPDGVEDAPQLALSINRDNAYAKGVSISSINDTLSALLGSSYLGDFPNRGRMQRVMMMADADFRMQPEDLTDYTAYTSDGREVPLSELISLEWKMGPMQAQNYNGFPAVSIQGAASPGHSTGQAMAAIEEIFQQLPKGFAIEWTGQSLEERRAGSMSLYLYGSAIIAVFLCLAALYESWTIPLSVMLVVPFGFLGIVVGTLLRGIDNDIYFQVGMITVIGLSAKNAILIVEFAKDLQQKGKPLIPAVLTAAQLRYRPIIMTSLAFIVGVMPLFFASGASSASQRAVGTVVLSGMAFATFFSVLFVPVFYIFVRRICGNKNAPPKEKLLVATSHQPGHTESTTSKIE